MKKWGDYQKKKFFVNNSIGALILFNEDHQGLFKLYVPLGGFRVRKKASKKGILFEK